MRGHKVEWDWADGLLGRWIAGQMDCWADGLRTFVFLLLTIFRVHVINQLETETCPQFKINFSVKAAGAWKSLQKRLRSGETLAVHMRKRRPMQ